MTDYYDLQRAVTPDQITQQNSLQKAGGVLKAIKHFVAGYLIYAFF
jgi:hypothetical protein